MSGLLDLISNFIEITGNSVVDTIIVSIIGVISFLVAFGFVGMIFDAIGKYDSDVMSDVHWGIRFIVFIVLSGICIGIAKLVKWLFSFQWWIYLIVFILFVGIIILVYLLKHNHSKKKALTNKTTIIEEDKKIEDNTSVTTIDKNHCPRCGALLVKRHGPFGDFYGCENYSVNGCRYTRKFK